MSNQPSSDQSVKVYIRGCLTGALVYKALAISDVLSAQYFLFWIIFILYYQVLFDDQVPADPYLKDTVMDDDLGSVHTT
jgi:hypothetical protein